MAQKDYWCILKNMKIKLKSTCALADLNKSDRPALRLKAVLGIVVLTCLTGCVGYVDGGGDVAVVGGPVVVAGPGWGFFGGYDRGHDVRGYSARGAESRGAAHSGGGGHGGRR